MLVDLARNDLSRVCQGGSVSVPEYMRVEEFSHVQHIVSKVQGTLRKGSTAMDALCSVFPAGTVSGAPKPRAMEIIGEMEGQGRGPYAGGVGYMSLNGNLDTAITIRSAFASEGKLHFQAGAGIVADSDPGPRVRGDRAEAGGAAGGPAPGHGGLGMNVLILDNYDSFVYNLKQYLEELGADCLVARNDALSLDQVGSDGP